MKLLNSVCHIDPTYFQPCESHWYNHTRKSTSWKVSYWLLVNGSGCRTARPLPRVGKECTLTIIWSVKRCREGVWRALAIIGVSSVLEVAMFGGMKV